jgi:ribosomal protein S18 acetylase RimI-like enzyme
VASALLARTLTGLAESGYRFAELGVDADSPTGAGRLYERAGFRTFTTSRVLGLRL